MRTYNIGEYPDPDTAHPVETILGKERQVAFLDALALILRNGFTLTHSDLVEFKSHYGYTSRNASNASAQMAEGSTKGWLAMRGVDLVEEKYKRRNIYRDGSIEISETDLSATKAKIDEKLERN